MRIRVVYIVCRTGSVVLWLSKYPSNATQSNMYNIYAVVNMYEIVGYIISLLPEQPPSSMIFYLSIVIFFSPRSEKK